MKMRHWNTGVLYKHNYRLLLAELSVHIWCSRALLQTEALYLARLWNNKQKISSLCCRSRLRCFYGYFNSFLTWNWVSKESIVTVLNPSGLQQSVHSGATFQIYFFYHLFNSELKCCIKLQVITATIWNVLHHKLKQLLGKTAMHTANNVWGVLKLVL